MKDLSVDLKDDWDLSERWQISARLAHPKAQSGEVLGKHITEPSRCKAKSKVK